MTTTPNLGMTNIGPGQDAAITALNADLRELDALVMPAVIDRTHSAPPSATAGDRYIVAASPTGAWDPLGGGEYEGFIACSDGVGWKFYEPKNGWAVKCTAEGVTLRNDGGGGITSWKATTDSAYFSAYDGTGGASLTSSWTPVTWTVEVVESSPTFAHSGSSADVTLAEAGLYLVTFDVGVTVTATNGTNKYEAKLTLGGSDVTGSLAQCNLLYAGTALFAQMSITMVVNATAGQALNGAVRRASGSSTSATVANSSRITVRKL